MKSHTITGVPRVAMFIGDASYLTPFIGSLYAAIKPLGGQESYADILAPSGAGNRMRWAQGKWDPSNVDLLQCEEPPFAPHYRALKAVGWEGIFRLTKPISGHKSTLVDADTAKGEILTSLDAGIPVIALGIVGPPECCVVFGYEDDGNILSGWNYFQGDEGFDLEKPFQKANWFDGMWGYLLLTKQVPKPSIRESGLNALKAIVRHARTDEVRGAKVGFSAWESALYQLEHDNFEGLPVRFPEGKPGNDDTWQNSLQGRFFVYCDMLCQVHERGVALPYWRKLAQAEPEWAGELNAAISCWDECASYGGYLWNYLTMDEAGYEKFRLADIRKILADEGYRCMGKDQEAISHIETLLAGIG